MNRQRARITALACVLTALLLTPAAPAAAYIVPIDAGSGLFITFAARVCSTYSDVMANKARNNVMESLRDLGPDTNYASTQVVDAASEQAGSPACQPLEGWRMTMGTGYVGKSPATLELSTVTGAYGTDVVTQPAVPLLSPLGIDTGAQLSGAVTVELDAAQAAFVRGGGRIWVQGGTPAAPLNGQQTTYGFAALRCAQDAVNGDNVEYITFPHEQTHVFCYYYAVTPPPDPGTITIRKQLAPGEAGPVDFTFVGNLSYADADGDGVNDFRLRVNQGSPAEMTFVRGAVGPGDPAWEISEVLPDGWADPGAPSCVADGSTITTAGGVTSIRLASGSDVVCTYTNQRAALGDGLLYKETVGGVGEFPVTITGPDAFERSVTAVVTEPNIPVLVATDASIPAGTYTISEQLPAPTGAGSWELVSAVCSDVELIGTVVVDGQWRRIDVDVPAGGAAHCLWINEFTPAGALSILKSTVGDTGTFPFSVSTLDDSGDVITAGRYLASATTSAEGVPVAATAEGDPATGITVEPEARLLVEERLPAWSPEGHWHVLDIDCGANEVVEDRRAASVEVVLTTDAPAAVCSFTNEWVPGSLLTIVKTTSPDLALRPDAAVLLLSCDETEWPNETGEVVFEVPAGEAQNSHEFSIMHASECRVVESDTGAAGGVSVTTTATLAVDGAPAVDLAPYDADFAVPRGADIALAIDNVLARAPGPGPDVDDDGELAASGAEVGGVALAGLAALAAGLLLAAGGRMRHTRR